MDPQLGRWHVIDALSEKYYSHSPYAYTMNDPVNHIDVMGLASMQIPYLHIGSTHAGTADLWGFFHNYDFNGTFDNAGGMSGNGGNGGGASGHWEDVNKIWEIVTDWYVNGKYVDTRTTYEQRPGKEWVWDRINLGGKAAQDFYRKFIYGRNGLAGPNQPPPDWNSLSDKGRVAVILNAWYKNSKNGAIILDVESLFENFPDAVVGGIIKADINLQRLEFFFGKRNHIHFELHIGSSSEYENIIEFGIVETRLGGHRDADGIPERRVWDFNNTQDSRIVTMSFPRQYETWFRIWLGF